MNARFPSLTPWIKLVRTGVPAFRVIRRPIRTLGQEVAVGEVVPDGLILNKVRLRQMYEQRYIEPILSESSASQKPRHREATKAAPKAAPTFGSDLPIAVSIPVTEEAETNTKTQSKTGTKPKTQSGGYKPRNKKFILKPTSVSRSKQ